MGDDGSHRQRRFRGVLRHAFLVHHRGCGFFGLAVLLQAAGVLIDRIEDGGDGGLERGDGRPVGTTGVELLGGAGVQGDGGHTLVLGDVPGVGEGDVVVVDPDAQSAFLRASNLGFRCVKYIQPEAVPAVAMAAMPSPASCTSVRSQNDLNPRI